MVNWNKHGLKYIEILKNYIMGQSMGQTNWTQFDPFWTTYLSTSTYVDIKNKREMN